MWYNITEKKTIKERLVLIMQWRIQGRASPYFYTKLRPEGPKKFFLEISPPPPPSTYLSVSADAFLLYLKIWICHCHNVRANSHIHIFSRIHLENNELREDIR